MLIYYIFLNFCLFKYCTSLDISLIPVGNFKGNYDPTTLYLTRCKLQYMNCYGGVSRLLTKYSNIQSENKIFINTGNNFKLNNLDTDYDLSASFNILKALKFDLISLGDEDLDLKKSEMFEYINTVQTPVISTNLKSSYKNGFNINKSTIVKIINPVEGEQKIAFLSVIDNEKYKFNKFRYTDPIQAISQEISRLKKEKINKFMLICYCDDILVNKIINENFEFSSIILENYNTETILETEDKNNTIIFKLLPNYYLSEINLTFDKTGKIKDTNFQDYLLNQDIKQDESLSWFLKVNNRHKKNNKQVGYSKVDLLNNCFDKECNLISLILKSMIYSYINETIEDGWAYSSIAFYNPLDVKSSILKGVITLEDVFDVFYRNEKWDTFDLSGEQLLKLLSLKIKGTRLYFEGIKIINNRDETIKVYVNCNNCTTPTYDLLDNNKLYKIIIQKSIYENYIKENNITIINYNSNNILSIKSFIKYITKHSPLTESTAMNIITI